MREAKGPPSPVQPDDPSGPSTDPDRSAPVEDVRAWLARAADLDPAEVAGVLQADQVRRWRSGERIPLEAYLQLASALREDEELALDLIWGEVLLRQERGESPTMAEYQWRFPRFAEPLRLQFEIDRGFAEGLPAGATPGVADRSTVAGLHDRAGPRQQADWSRPGIP